MGVREMINAIKNDLLRGVSKRQFTFQFNSSAKKHLPVRMFKTRHPQKIRAGYGPNPALILGIGCTAVLDISFFFFLSPIGFPGHSLETNISKLQLDPQW